MKLRKVLALLLCIAMFIGSAPVITAKVVRVFTESVSEKVYFSPAARVIAGDINGDGSVNNKDLTRLFQYLSDWDVEINQAALDTNGDGSVNNKDLTRLFQYLSDWDVEIYPEPVTCEHTGGTEVRDTRAPSCSAEGYTGDTYCLDCGALIAYGTAISKLPHTGGTANCHTKAVCEVCGAEYGDLNPNLHDGGTEIRDDYPATCVFQGYTGNVYCLGCNMCIRRGEYTEPTGIHTNTELQGVIEATCSSLGYTGDLVCLDCGMTLEWGTYTDFSDVHVNTHVEGAVTPTCTDYGYTGDIYCDDCNNYVKRGTVIEPTGHLNTEVRDVYPATCGDCGYTGDTYCLDCGMLVELGTSIDATGIHLNTGITGDYPPTCETGGYTGDTYCLDCGAIISQGTYIEPTGHLNREIRGAYPATCTGDGYTGDEYCLDCGMMLTSGEPIQPTGHLHTEIRDAIPVTCSADGYTGDTYCLDCGECIMPGTYIQSPGCHTGGEATYYQKATCMYCGEEYGDYENIVAYDQLSKTQKGVYDAMDAAVNEFNRSWFEVPFDPEADRDKIDSDIRVAFHALSYDRPQYFWMPKVYVHMISTNQRTGAITRVRCSFAYDAGTWAIDYPVSEDLKQRMQWALEQKIEDILAQARTYETDFEKELFIHDYLCRNITYDHFAAENPDEADPLSWTVYGALMNGKCVCEGYSRSMQLICQRLGIPCSLVTGFGMGGPHMWNIIRIGDGLYYLDVTFDDSIEKLESTSSKIDCLYDYFNVTAEMLEADHYFDSMFVQDANYSNTGVDFNLFETHGDYTEAYYYTATGAHINANDADDAAEYIIREANNIPVTVGKKYVTLEYDASISAREAFVKLKTALAGRVNTDTEYTTFEGKPIILIGIFSSVTTGTPAGYDTAAGRP